MRCAFILDDGELAEIEGAMAEDASGLLALDGRLPELPSRTIGLLEGGELVGMITLEENGTPERLHRLAVEIEGEGGRSWTVWGSASMARAGYWLFMLRAKERTLRRLVIRKRGPA